MNIIETDIKGDIEFFQPYLDSLEWVDINKAYSDYSEYEKAMEFKKPHLQYIKHIENYDMKLKKFIVGLLKKYGIKTQDFRCDFFLTKPGGYLPAHVDEMAKIAILVPLTENTGALIVDEKEHTYQNAVILNTRVLHEVKSPTKDRLLFRIAIHDFDFTDIQIRQPNES